MERGSSSLPVCHPWSEPAPWVVTAWFITAGVLDEAARGKLPGTATVAKLGDTKGAGTHRKVGEKLWMLQAALSVLSRLSRLQTPWDRADAGKEQENG